MKATALLPVLLIILCSACNRSSSKSSTAKDETPLPLQDNTSDLTLVKKSRGNTLFEDLYNDQLKKQPELKKLEDQLEHFNMGLADSLKSFNNYNSKSTEYYDLAKASLSDMKDTVLRANLEALIAESKHKYMDTINRFSVLITHIDSNKIRAEDYHAMLKIIVTLPVIESYQYKSLPDIRSTANMANEAQRLKANASQLTKKYGNANR